MGNEGKKVKKPVPGLDFSNLKQVKDFKDWYSYAKKLEDAIRLLREKIVVLEDESQNYIQRIQQLEIQV